MVTRENVTLGIQAIVTLATIGTSLFLWATAGEVPNELLGITAVITGYFFNTSQQVISKGLK